jgi:iron transport multicopper oxidase
MEAGLSALLIEAPNKLQERMRIPEQVYRQCNHRNVKTTGNAAGFNNTIDFAGIEPTLELYPDYLETKGFVSLAAMILSALLGLGAILWHTLE